MISEWMKVMLEEISRKKAEAEQARVEEQARARASPRGRTGQRGRRAGADQQGRRAGPNREL